MSNPESQTQDSIALDDIDGSEIEDLGEGGQQLREKVEQLAREIAEVREDMVHVVAVKGVLERYGLSSEKAAEIVETVEEVSASLGGDADE